MQWLQAFKRSHLDLTLAVPPGLTTRIISRPGLVLDDASLAVLVEQLKSVARKVLPDGDLTYGVLGGSRDRLDHAVITLVSDAASGEAIAFNALALMEATLDGEPLQITHLGLVMVDPGQRGQGLSWVLYGLTTLLLFLRNGMRPLWISNVTQVPAVVGMVSETFSDVFPSPLPASRQSFSHLQLARQIMRQHRHVFGVGTDAGFDEARSIITNAYTGGSDDLKKRFEDAAPHRDDRYNAFCRQGLDYDRGDDVLQLGRIDLAGAKSYVLKQVPRASLPQLLGTAAFLIVQRLILPLLHWLDASRRFGPLRPISGAK
jgi:hypothetical protein